jgi:hypothetical protein
VSVQIFFSGVGTKFFSHSVRKSGGRKSIRGAVDYFVTFSVGTQLFQNVLFENHILKSFIFFTFLEELIVGERSSRSERYRHAANSSKNVFALIALL